MFRSCARRGFTFVELLVVIFIIGLLLCLLWPSTSCVREAGRRAACINNMRQIGIALHNFHDAHHHFPGSNDVPLLKTPSASWAGVPLHTPAQPDPSVGPAEYGTNYSWLAKITPYMEETTVHKWIDFVNLRAWDLCKNNPIDPKTGMPVSEAIPCLPMAWRTPIPVFKCATSAPENFCQANPKVGITTNPYDPLTPYGPAALTNYVALGATHSDSLLGVETNPLAGGAAHPNGTIFPGGKIGIDDVTDGTSNTFIVCETIEPTLAAWYEGSTAAVFGLVGKPSFEQTDDPKGNYGVPTQDARTTINWGDDGSKPVTFYLPTGPQGIAWLHGPSSNHPGLVNHLAGDASVHSVEEGINPRLYMHLITRSGNEPVNEFFEE